jgi:hypothetical protein
MEICSFFMKTWSDCDHHHVAQLEALVTFAPRGVAVEHEPLEVEGQRLPRPLGLGHHNVPGSVDLPHEFDGLRPGRLAVDEQRHGIRFDAEMDFVPLAVEQLFSAATGKASVP